MIFSHTGASSKSVATPITSAEQSTASSRRHAALASALGASALQRARAQGPSNANPSARNGCSSRSRTARCESEDRSFWIPEPSDEDGARCEPSAATAPEQSSTSTPAVNARIAQRALAGRGRRELVANDRHSASITTLTRSAEVLTRCSGMTTSRIRSVLWSTSPSLTSCLPMSASVTVNSRAAPDQNRAACPEENRRQVAASNPNTTRPYRAVEYR